MDRGFARLDEKIDRGVGDLKAMMRSFIETQGGINGDLNAGHAHHEQRLRVFEDRAI